MKLRLLQMKSVKSTNDTAIKLIKNDRTKPTLITSINQKKGRGTMGKKWISIKGNLFISIYFEIYPKKINFKQFAILNAYLIKKAISNYTTEKIDIKWPNDLLIKKQKVCGILQEIIEHKEKTFLIVGVGINIVSSPDIMNFKTTSLRNMSKKNIERNNILKEIKKNYEKFILESNQFNFSYLKEKYK